MLFIKGRGFPQGAKGLVSRWLVPFEQQVEILLDPIVILDLLPGSLRVSPLKKVPFQKWNFIFRPSCFQAVMLNFGGAFCW